jgi:hypothetical protein
MTVAVDEVRYDDLGPRRVMAVAEGYVMVRRPGCAPRLMTLKEWAKASPTPLEGSQYEHDQGLAGRRLHRPAAGQD